MGLLTTAELTEIVNGEDGIDGTLTTASPAGTASVRLLFRKNFFEKDIGDDVGWSGYEFKALGVPETFTNAKQNDTILINGVTYNIRDKYETDDGWCVLPLMINN